MGINRRSFIGFTVGAAAGTVVGRKGTRVLSDLVQATEPDVYPPRGPEDEVLSVCALCAGGCGVRVRRIGGRPVKLAGNPLHPVNRGRLCPRGQAGLQLLFHPDRIPGPLRRRGPRGSLASFEQVSWDEALSELGNRLGAVRERRADGLYLVRTGMPGIDGRVAARFAAAFGSPHDVVLAPGDAAALRAGQLTQGLVRVPVYDLARADYVLSVDSALLEGTANPVFTMRTFGEFRRGRPGRRGKLIQVEARKSLTASIADEWIGVRPGTAGIFALGVAAVLANEGLYREGWVREHTVGFEGRGGLREVLERHFTLERVAAETGVPVTLVLRIARELAAAHAPLVVGPRRGPTVGSSVLDYLAALSLNALLGTIDRPGGVLTAAEDPPPDWPALEPSTDGDRESGSSSAAGVADAAELSLKLLQAEEPAQALLVLDGDPAYEAPEAFGQAIETIPLIISFALLPNDTALLADWILPPPHFLERWDVFRTPPGFPFNLASLAQPVLESPLHDAKAPAEVLLELARELGDGVASALPFKDLRSLVRAEVKGLAAARRGNIMGTAFDEELARLMDRSGWWAPRYRSARELWEGMQESGGWWDPLYDHEDWKRVLRAADAAFVFPATHLRELAERQRGAELGHDRLGATGTPTLELVLFEPLAAAGAHRAGLPFLQGILDPVLEEGWETWVEIHPETAAPIGVEDRSWVEVRSEHGAIRARARLTSRVVPGVVAIPVGLGPSGGGRWAESLGANPLRLLPPGRPEAAELGTERGTRVRLVSSTALSTATAGRA